MRTIFVATITLCVASITAAAGEYPIDRDPHLIEISAYAAKPTIRSTSDLEGYLAANPDCPINELSHGGREAFLSSLVFTEMGLGSLNYQTLEEELTPTQIHAVLSLFGLGELITQFQNARVETSYDERLLSLENPAQSNYPCRIIENAYCDPPATCRYENGAFCITCNCGMQEP